MLYWYGTVGLACIEFVWYSTLIQYGTVRLASLHRSCLVRYIVDSWFKWHLYGSPDTLSTVQAGQTLAAFNRVVVLQGVVVVVIRVPRCNVVGHTGRRRPFGRDLFHLVGVELLSDKKLVHQNPHKNEQNAKHWKQARFKTTHSNNYWVNKIVSYLVISVSIIFNLYYNT